MTEAQTRGYETGEECPRALACAGGSPDRIGKFCGSAAYDPVSHEHLLATAADDRLCPPALERSDRVRLTFLGIVAVCSVLGVLSATGTAATPTTFQSGTLIIPMDTDTSANHATYNQN